MDAALKRWHDATTGLEWGTHSVFKEALQQVADENIKMVFQADDYNGSPCLVNAVRPMLIADGKTHPMSAFPGVVGAFDEINNVLRQEGINASDNKYVSPLAAEILLRHMGKPGDKPDPNDDVPLPELAIPYREASDEDLALDWSLSLDVEFSDAPAERLNSESL